MSGRRLLGLSSLILVCLAAGCSASGMPQAKSSSYSGASEALHKAVTSTSDLVPTTTTTTSTTLPPCTAGATPGIANMAYLARAWNDDNVQEVDYVTDPYGRGQLDDMASLMVNLQFLSCSPNPTGDFTCYFNHDIAPNTTSTTYPDPGGYPPGEAVFTVAPAQASGWYLTDVQQCG